MTIDKDELERRKALTFEQAEGAAPLPRQLALKEISPVLAARLWHALRKNVLDFLHTMTDMAEPVEIALENYFLKRKGVSLDLQNFDSEKQAINSIRAIYCSPVDYVDALGTIQFFLRELREDEFSDEVANILEEERAAYRLFEGDTIIPVASKEAAENLDRAFEILTEHNQRGAKKHLLDAAARLSEGDFAGSVRESIHAVEAVVRSTTGKTNFKDALLELDKQQPMHRAFRNALISLYGYSSDEDGIRHSLLEGEHPNVSERDALFFIGVCAAFVTYLLSPTE